MCVYIYIHMHTDIDIRLTGVMVIYEMTSDPICRERKEAWTCHHQHTLLGGVGIVEKGQASSKTDQA